MASAVIAIIAASCTVQGNGTTRPPAPTISTSPHSGVSQPTTPSIPGYLEIGAFNACSANAGEVTIHLTNAPAIPVQVAFTVNVFTSNPSTVYGTLPNLATPYESPWLPPGTCFGVVMSAFDASVQPAFTYTASWGNDIG